MEPVCDKLATAINATLMLKGFGDGQLDYDALDLAAGFMQEAVDIFLRMRRPNWGGDLIETCAAALVVGVSMVAIREEMHPLSDVILGLSSDPEELTKEAHRGAWRVPKLDELLAKE